MRLAFWCMENVTTHMWRCKGFDNLGTFEEVMKGKNTRLISMVKKLSGKIINFETTGYQLRSDQSRISFLFAFSENRARQ